MMMTPSGSYPNVLYREFGVVQYSPEENEQLIDLCKKAEISAKTSDTLCPFTAHSYKIITQKSREEMTYDVPAIPNDVIKLIFLNLDLKDFLAFAKTCKRIYLISKADLLWEDQMHKKFPNITILKYINPNEINITDCKTTKVKYESQIKIYTKKIENTLKPRLVFINKVSTQIDLLKKEKENQCQALKEKYPTCSILETIPLQYYQFLLFSQSEKRSESDILQILELSKIEKKIEHFEIFNQKNQSFLQSMQKRLYHQEGYENIIQLSETNHNTIDLLDLDKKYENEINIENADHLSWKILYVYEQQALKEISKDSLLNLLNARIAAIESSSTGTE